MPERDRKEVFCYSGNLVRIRLVNSVDLELGHGQRDVFNVAALIKA